MSSNIDATSEATPMDYSEEDDLEVVKEILSEPTKEKLADLKKTEGNNLYKEGKYRDALPLYTEAINHCPENALLYLNRAACYVMLHEYRSAMDDCKETLKRDSNNVKALMREAKCFMCLGDPFAALRSLAKVKQIDPQNLQLAKEIKSVEALEHFVTEGDKAYRNGDYRKCVYCMDRALNLSPGCVKFKLLKAECLAYINRLADARDISSDIIRFENNNADAYLVRGLVLYYEDQIDKAFQHFQQVLRLAPDHPKALAAYRKAKNLKNMKDKGNEFYKAGKYQEAYDTYTEALKLDPNNKLTNAKLHFNRANCCGRLNRLNETLEDCTKAIDLDSNYIKAYLRRAKCYQDLEMYEEAVRDYESVYQKEKTREHKKYVDDAKLELKKSKRKDYYKILGISKQASEDEIKRAYKKRALIHHPDRHANASDQEKKDQEKKFKELGEAYNILSDPKKKSRYDNGVDIEDLDGHGGHGMDDMDAFMAFYRGFGGPSAGGYQFRFG